MQQKIIVGLSSSLITLLGGTAITGNNSTLDQKLDTISEQVVMIDKNTAITKDRVETAIKVQNSMVERVRELEKQSYSRD